MQLDVTQSCAGSSDAGPEPCRQSAPSRQSPPADGLSRPRTVGAFERRHDPARRHHQGRQRSGPAVEKASRGRAVRMIHWLRCDLGARLIRTPATHGPTAASSIDWVRNIRNSHRNDLRLTVSTTKKPIRKTTLAPIGGVFPRMCRAEIGIHHCIAGASLLRYAEHSSWREDNRRQLNGEDNRTSDSRFSAHARCR